MPPAYFHPYQVERAFEAWRRGQLAPERLLNTAMVRQAAPTTKERDRQLQALIDAVIFSKLNEYRGKLGLPLNYDRSDMTTQGIEILRDDYCVNNLSSTNNHEYKLFVWSLVNVTLANPVMLNRRTIARALNMDMDTFQRYIFQGVVYLTDELLEIEDRMSGGGGTIV